MKSIGSKKLISFGIFLILSLIWGSSFILIKTALIAFEWHQVAALRMSVTMICFSPFVVAAIKKVNSREVFIAILLMAFFGNGLPAFLYPIAQTQIDSSLAGILNASTPISTLLVGAIIFKVVPTRHKIIGVLMGIIGASLLVLYGQEHKAGTNNLYGLFIIVATICYGISSNVIKKYLQNISPLTTSAVAFIVLGPIGLVYLFTTDFLTIMKTDENAWLSLASVSTLAVMSTAVGTLLFIRLIQMTNPVFSSMVSYLAPMIAISFGFLDGETITHWHFVGILLILFGIYLANSKE
jgi:drug/metabolite transporter (DMT)-like permease